MKDSNLTPRWLLGYVETKPLGGVGLPFYTIISCSIIE